MNTPAASPSALTDWLATLTAASLPPTVLDTLRSSLLDTVAVAWAARRAAGMQAVSQLVGAEGGAPHSLLWDGSGRRVPAAAAAFHNGSYAAALDFDSLHPSASHIDAVVIPAALAVAEQVHASGRQLLAAIAAGAELAYRLGEATRARPGWFRTSVYGVFGAAAATARLLELSSGQFNAALGIALGQAAGTQQGHIERKLSKRLLSAFAARAGVFSAQLAQQGITGPDHAFDGRHGLFVLYGSGDADPAQLTTGLGSRFLIERTSYKQFPACGCAHAAIEAALRVAGRAAGQGWIPDRIRRVEVVITPYMDKLVGAPYSTEGDPEVTGQFCVQYAVAAALSAGVFTPAQIASAAVLDPGLRPLIDRVHVRVEGDGAMAPATVNVVLDDGSAHAETVTALPGSPEAPLDAAALRAKAHGALAQGAGWTPAAADSLIARLAAIDQLDDVAALFASS